MLVVEYMNGLRVDNGDSSVGANGRVLRVSPTALSGGTYNVKWRAQSTDTHNSEPLCRHVRCFMVLHAV